MHDPDPRRCARAPASRAPVPGHNPQQAREGAVGKTPLSPAPDYPPQRSAPDRPPAAGRSLPSFQPEWPPESPAPGPRIPQSPGHSADLRPVGILQGSHPRQGLYRPPVGPLAAGGACGYPSASGPAARFPPPFAPALAPAGRGLGASPREVPPGGEPRCDDPGPCVPALAPLPQLGLAPPQQPVSGPTAYVCPSGPAAAVPPAGARAGHLAPAHPRPPRWPPPGPPGAPPRGSPGEPAPSCAAHL